jgi:hypothetical protein
MKKAKTLKIWPLMLVVIIAAATALQAQQADSANNAALMKQLEWMQGSWKGKATTQQGGAQHTVLQEEHVSKRLNDQILTIEGTGHDTTSIRKKVFHAFGVISVGDDGQYQMHCWLADGRSVRAWLEVPATNTVHWGFDAPAGSIQYVIVHDPQRRAWNETGTFSPTGTNKHYPFFDMALIKQ